MASISEDGRRIAPGRIRSAIAVLFGRSITPQQLQQDFIEWELVLGGILDRFSALLARQAKAEKKRVELELSSSEENATGLNARMAPTGWNRKAELYSRAAAARGLSQHVPRNGGVDP